MKNPWFFARRLTDGDAVPRDGLVAGDDMSESRDRYAEGRDCHRGAAPSRASELSSTRAEHRWRRLVYAAVGAGAMACSPRAPSPRPLVPPSAPSAPFVAPARPPPIDAASRAQAASGSASAGKPAAAPGPLESAERSLAVRLRVPLVSEDGKLVVTGLSMESTSEDRFVLLRIRDVDTDREVNEIASDRGADPARQLALFAEASAALDAQNWALVTTYETATDVTAKERSHGLGSAVAIAGAGEGLRVRFHEPTLIVDEASGHPLFRRAFPGWSKKGPVAGQSCVTYADLRRVWANRKLGVMVVEVGYSGSPHFCSFASELHVIRFAHP